jgi:succinate dehydrogenase (ubiquinone) membrane anchor subunit
MLCIFICLTSPLSSADTGKLGTKFFHLSGYTLVGLFPFAMVWGNSMVTVPCDLALGILMPIHGHVGLNYIVSDYIPPAARGERASQATLHFLNDVLPYNSYPAEQQHYLTLFARFMYLGATRAGLVAATAVTILGLLKLNIQGPGLTGSLKQMWKSPEKKS